MAIKINQNTLFVYFTDKRKPTVKILSDNSKFHTFLEMLEKNPIRGKERITKIVFTDTIAVSIYNTGNYEFEEPNHFFTADEAMLKKLGNLPDNSISYLENEIISEDLVTAEYNDIFSAVIAELSDDIDAGMVTAKKVAGAINRTLKNFGVKAAKAIEFAAELKRDMMTYINNAVPAQYQSQSLLNESQQDFQALQQAAQDSYQQLVDEFDQEAVDVLDEEEETF